MRVYDFRGKVEIHVWILDGKGTSEADGELLSCTTFILSNLFLRPVLMRDTAITEARQEWRKKRKEEKTRVRPMGMLNEEEANSETKRTGTVSIPVLVG